MVHDVDYWIVAKCERAVADYQQFIRQRDASGSSAVPLPNEAAVCEIASMTPRSPAGRAAMAQLFEAIDEADAIEPAQLRPRDVMARAIVRNLLKR